MDIKVYINDVEQILQGAPSKVLDFSKPEHADFFLKYHGGEELLKKRYASVHANFVALQSQLHNNAEQGGLSPYNGTVTLNVAPSVSDSGNQSGGQLTGRELYSVESACVANVQVGEVCQVHMSGMVVNKKTSDYFFNIYEIFRAQEIQNMKGVCTVENQDVFYLTPDMQISSYCEFSFYDKSGQMIGYMITQGDYDTTVIDPVESFVVANPTVRFDSHKEVQINYLAREGNFDYKYEVEPDKVTKQVDIMLPLSGSILLKPGFEACQYAADSQSINMKLTYSGGATATNGLSQAEIAKMFSQEKVNKCVDGKDIEQWLIKFTIPDKWVGTFFRFSSFPTGTTAMLSFPFFYTTIGKFFPDSDTITQVNVGMCILNSTTATKFNISAKKTVYIRPLVYLWGCFGKSTEIRMADGSMKSIADIQHGDMVVSHEDAPVTVQNIFTGTEAILYHVETENGCHIAVTETHPLLTRRGIVHACRVTPADEMVMEDGTTSPVRFVYPEDYNDCVYSLDLGSSHYVYANGFAAGDYNAQNEWRPEIDQLTPEAEAMLEEASRLFCDLKETFPVPTHA